MVYDKKKAWHKIIMSCNRYDKMTSAQQEMIRKTNGLKGLGGHEDGCIEFIAFEIIRGLVEYRLILNKSYRTVRKSIILHNWQRQGYGIKADIDLIYDNGGLNIKHKIRVTAHKREEWFKMIKWGQKTQSHPLGQYALQSSRAMILTERKNVGGFETEYFQVFYPHLPFKN